MGRGQELIVRFGGYRLDANLRRLTLEASGDVVPLGSRAFDVLNHLASRAGKLASKAELMEAGWPDVTVEENSLTQCISTIRKALGPAAGCIVTEAGRGYRFLAAVPDDRPRGRAAWRTTDNPEAYRLFISAWSAMMSPGRETCRKAIERLEKAIMLDPHYAVAHVQLGMSYACLGTFGFVKPRDIIAEARAPVLRALELNPLLAEAYAELGHQQAFLDLNPAAAEKSIRRALELDPDGLPGLALMGALAGMRGQVDESHTYFRRVQLIEPLAPNVNHGVAVGYYRKGNYLAAIAQLEVALELNPNYGVARSLLGRCYLRVGDYDRAIAEFSICEPTIGTDADLPSAFALSGRSGEARTALEALLAEAADRYVSALDVATIHAALGDAEQALTWLQRAVEEVAPMAWGIKTEPAFAHLRTDPRFQSLVNRIGVE